MGKKIMKLKYKPSLNSIEDVDHIKKSIKSEDMVLVGDYGAVNPLALVDKLKELDCSGLFLEVTSADKNRDAIESAILSAAVTGFKGVVIASGLFNKKNGMGKPVYDLDTPQMLKLAASMKEEKKIDGEFQIGVRSPSGSKAADARSRYFMENGADFLLFTGDDISGEAADKSFIEEEI